MFDENKSRHIEQYPKEITRQDDSMSTSLQQPDNISQLTATCSDIPNKCAMLITREKGQRISTLFHDDDGVVAGDRLFDLADLPS